MHVEDIEVVLKYDLLWYLFSFYIILSFYITFHCMGY